MTDASEIEEIGYGRTPTSTRFKKGQSGNPRGRPRNRSREIPYDYVLGQMVTIREGGSARRVTAAEAFLLQLTQRGLQGDSGAARASLAAIEDARSKRHSEAPTITSIVCKSVSPGSVGSSLDALCMAAKLRRYTEDAEYRLQPWIVEAALARLGDRRLSQEEQQRVVASTRTPEKIGWPDWWLVRRP